jgi:hypothetical protein
MPPFQRSTVRKQCDGSDDKIQHQVTLVARSEKRSNIHVLSSAKTLELRPSENLGRLVATLRESMGMRNYPLRLIRRQLTDEARFGHGCGRSEAFYGMKRRRRRQRGTANYLHYSIYSCRKDEGQETTDE